MNRSDPTAEDHERNRIAALEYICKYYGVPAKIGCRVKYHPWNKMAVEGTIVGVNGQYLSIKIDGEESAKNYHPTYSLCYL